MSELLFKLSDVYMENMPDTVIPEDCGALLGEICINRVVGVTYKNILKIKEFKAPSEFNNTLKAVYSDNIKRAERFKKCIKYLSELFSNANFNYVFLKGAYLTTKLYECGYRTSNDIDILVNESDITSCQDILLANDFVQGLYYKENVGIVRANRKDIIMSRMNYGETIPFYKMIDDEPLKIDLNFSIDFKPSGENKIVSELLNNKIEVPFEETKFNTLNYEDFLIHLCCHLYKEATTMYWVRRNRDLQIYKFCDINVFIHEFGSEQYYDKLVARIKYFGVENECYYTFVNSAEIYPCLQKTEGFLKMLDEIKPKNISFMKKIYDPVENRVYEYNMSFKEWFDISKRTDHLRSVEA